MDIEKIKETPIADFLSRLGFHPVKRRGAVLWYHAPYRGDKSPSFKLDTRKEKWFDFGMPSGAVHYGNDEPSDAGDKGDGVSEGLA